MPRRCAGVVIGPRYFSLGVTNPIGRFLVSDGKDIIRADWYDSPMMARELFGNFRD